MSIENDWHEIEARPVPGIWARPLLVAGPHAGVGTLNSRIPSGKRLFDVALAMILLVPTSVVMVVVAAVLLVAQGRPILFVQWRMNSPTRAFPLIKFRTMNDAPSEFSVTGADQHWRITRLGHFLRRTRIDELPQLFNILRGHMSFVGPRPPTPELVQAEPAVFAEVLAIRPGVTGLATLLYHRHEHHILKHCRSARKTRAVYLRRCLPTKARIDLIYRRHRTIGMDLWIIFATVCTVVIHPDRPFRRSYRLDRSARRAAKGSRG